MMFIGDFGRDYLAARDMIIKREIPLVGISSSIPWLSWFLVFFLAYVIHGAPSEAYFPVLFVALSLAWGLFMAEFQSRIGIGFIPVVLLLASWQVHYLLTH